MEDRRKRKQTSVPTDLVNEIVKKLERESDIEWTREYRASGGKTTTPAP